MFTAILRTPAVLMFSFSALSVALCLSAYLCDSPELIVHLKAPLFSPPLHSDRFGVTRYLFRNECLDVCPEGFHQSVRMRCEPSTYNSTTARLHPSCGDGSDADCLSCDEGCKKCKQSKQIVPISVFHSRKN